MNPFATIRQMLTWAFIYPIEETTNKWKERFYITFGIIIFLSELLVLASCGYLFSNYVSVDLESSLFPLFQLFGHIVAIYGILYLIYVRSRVVDIFTKLSTIFESSKNFYDYVSSFALFEKYPNIPKQILMLMLIKVHSNC